MKRFAPDIIVEVTRACDRQCRGCYAPNFLVGRERLVEEKHPPGLFITERDMHGALAILSKDTNVKTLGIRGGEPTLHPELPSLIELAANYADAVYLETHGRWLEVIDPDSPAARILDATRTAGAILKISFDRMHALTGNKLKFLLANAEAYGVSWVIAITEESHAAAESLLETVPWLQQERVLFQQKAVKVSELVRPRLGTVTSEGKIESHLTTKFMSASLASEAYA